MRTDGADQAEGLRRLLLRGPSQVLTVVAGQAGVGRTSTTINLAAALVRSGKDVLVLDENYTTGNLLESLGVVARHDLLDVAHGVCSPWDAVESSYGFGVMSAARAMHALAATRKSLKRSSSARPLHGVGLDAEECQRMEAALTEIGKDVDVMLVDAAMLAGQAAAVSSSLASGAALLLVVDATPAGITSSYAMIKRLALENARFQFGIAVNKAPSEKAAMTVFENMSKVARRNLSASLEYMGFVPQDDRLRIAMQMCKPVMDAFPGASSARAYRELAQNLLGLPSRQYEGGGVAGIVQSLMDQASQPLRSYSKEIAHVVN